MLIDGKDLNQLVSDVNIHNYSDNEWYWFVPKFYTLLEKVNLLGIMELETFKQFLGHDRAHAQIGDETNEVRNPDGLDNHRIAYRSYI